VHSNNRLKVISLNQATHDGLKGLIETRRPQIVHFIGHGRIKEGVSEIALMKTPEELAMAKADIVKKGLRGEPDEANWVTSDSMRALFKDAPPRIVFLQACNSDKAPSSREVFKSTAEQVLRAKVPFVVAMQYEISNEDATDFAKTFYKNLSDGLSIDEAVKVGRNELGKKEPSWGHPRFGTPVVYLQSEDSIIVLKEAKERKNHPLHLCRTHPASKIALIETASIKFHLIKNAAVAKSTGSSNSAQAARKPIRKTRWSAITMVATIHSSLPKSSDQQLSQKIPAALHKLVLAPGRQSGLPHQAREDDGGSLLCLNLVK
jgi:hypothetical protein